MKKYLFILLIALVAGINASAQDVSAARKKQIEAARALKTQKKEQMAAQKAAFITTRLNLTSKEAEKFWPVYNQFRSELDANRKQMGQLMKNNRTQAERTPEQLSQAMESRFDMEEEKLKIQRKYHKEFLRILTVQQVADLYQAEEDFKKEILKELRTRKK